MATFNPYFFIAGLVAFVGGLSWEYLTDRANNALWQQLKAQAIPDSREAWQRLRWRHPLRRFAQTVGPAIGVPLIFHSVCIAPNAPAAMRADHVTTITAIDSLSAITIVVFACIVVWKRRRYGSQNKEEIRY